MFQRMAAGRVTAAGTLHDSCVFFPTKNGINSPIKSILPQLWNRAGTERFPAGSLCFVNGC
jgi:hypothetical protein